ncbi:hypothetical protein JCM19055_2952 [Geomicrobium sp. JCM 19055]|nr:hypothetical protein JCM19055_2952 [Geomicrobium sp. JCM 19055]
MQVHELEHLTSGEYEATIELPRDGLYYVRADIEAETQRLMPTMHFAVGKLTQDEALILMGNDEENYTEVNAHH